jgi:subtilisin family serine protease
VLGAPAIALLLLPVTPAEAAQPPWGEWWFDTWGIQSKVWGLSQGSGVTVAVLDTGVDGSSGDLTGAVLPGTGLEVQGPFGGPNSIQVSQTGPGNADHSSNHHGTEMAELIAGRGEVAALVDPSNFPAGTGLAGAGVAPQAKILPIDLSGGRGLMDNGGFDYGLAAGIRYAVDHGAKVISVSLGEDRAGGCPAVHQDAIAYAVQHDVVVVVAAGNQGDVGNPADEPANCPGALAVGAVDEKGSSPPWTQRQPYVAVAAPGVDVPSINPEHLTIDGHPEAELTRGTSDSAALVAGVVALVRSRYPSMPARQVVQRITDTADRQPGQQAPSTAAGSGIVDVYRSIDVQDYPVPAGAPNPVYAAFDRWLASPRGRQFSRAQTTSAHSSKGVKLSPIAVAIGVAAVLLIVGATLGITLALLVSRRRKRTLPPPRST